MRSLPKALAVTNLTKVFHTKKLFQPPALFTAVDGISFAVKQGEVLGLLGPNGAGKTTTMHMLLGIMTPTGGTIEYFGDKKRSTYPDVLAHIGFASAYMKLPSSLTVQENLYMYGTLAGLDKQTCKNRIDQLLEDFAITALRSKSTGMLSAGQMTRVMLAKAFIHRPKIVLLDEPTASLDPDIAHEVRHFIQNEQKKYNTAVLLASHNMAEVSDICDRVLVMKQGAIVASGTPRQLATSIHRTKISLIVGDTLPALVRFLQEKSMTYSLDEPYIEIEVDEADIASLLTALAHAKIAYTHISIKKPTLEDYFLHIAQKGNN